MKFVTFLSGFISSLLTSGIILPASSQVTSDGTTNTNVNSNGNNFTIINGIEKGNNLFHSFREFSLPTGGSATFDLTNTPNITTIFSRVTGGSISNIDGLIRTLNSNNSINLFLINPKGIVFGKNAKLDIGGSFLGTTAESVLFEDEFQFSAINTQSTALLKVSVPMGLQMGMNSGAIQVNGTGHRLIGGELTPVIRSNTQSTLQVNPGKAIALVGRNVNLSGGVLTAENGRVELGGVQAGTVGLNYTSTEFQLDYGEIKSFGDIQLVKQSLVDASGLTSGGIQIQGENISLKDGSGALIQTIGTQAPGNIKVSAADFLYLSGNVRTAPDLGIVTGVISSRFMSENLGAGKGANIDISAGNLTFDNGGLFVARTYSAANGGNITVNITGDIQGNRTAPLNPNILSGIVTSNFSFGKSGDISIIASNIVLTDGSKIITTTLGQGDGGNLDVNVSGTIEIRGLEPRNLSISGIDSTTFSEGKGGSLSLNTSKLILENGAGVTAGTLNSGQGGTVTINASGYIGVKTGSTISTAAAIFPKIFRQNFGLPDRPSGDAGNLTINTPNLQVDNGRVSVNNQGSGNGGNLNISTNSLLVSHGGKLIANTASGEGGNIKLNLKSDLILRNNSLIDTEALGTGNGGNITINSPIIAGFENSDIIANAVEGNGGNIDIATQGVFGLKFRDSLTPGNDITASSEFGINGTVEINNIAIDPGSGLIELPEELSDSSQQIATGCSNNIGSSFVTTGRGGIPQNPTQQIDISRSWSDIRDLSTYSQQKNNEVVEITNLLNQPVILEANSFIRNASGEIELIAAQSTPLVARKLAGCSGV
ncbi:MAG: filamentous hemagglutinin N-terminal domain-containing protein [Cyanobacteria bacterium P01_A01_bin.84]